MENKDLRTLVQETIKEVKDYGSQIVFYTGLIGGLFFSPLLANSAEEKVKPMEKEKVPYSHIIKLNAQKDLKPELLLPSLENFLKTNKGYEPTKAKEEAKKILDKALDEDEGDCLLPIENMDNTYTFNFDKGFNFIDCEFKAIGVSKKEGEETKGKKSSEGKKEERYLPRKPVGEITTTVGEVTTKKTCVIKVDASKGDTLYKGMPELEKCLQPWFKEDYQIKATKILEKAKDKCLPVKKNKLNQYTFILDEKGELNKCYAKTEGLSQTKELEVALPLASLVEEKKPETILPPETDKSSGIETTLSELRTKQEEITAGLGDLKKDLEGRSKDYQTLKSQVEELISPENKVLNEALKLSLKEIFDQLTPYETMMINTCQNTWKAGQGIFGEGTGDYYTNLKNEIKAIAENKELTDHEKTEQMAEKLKSTTEDLNKFKKQKEGCDKAKAEYDLAEKNYKKRKEELLQTIKRNLTDENTFSITPFAGLGYNNALYGLAGAKIAYGKGWKATAQGAAFFRGQTTPPTEVDSENPVTKNVGSGYQNVSSLEKGIDRVSKYLATAGIGTETPDLIGNKNWSLTFNFDAKAYLGEKTETLTTTRTSQLKYEGEEIGNEHRVSSTTTDKELIFSFVPQAGAEICYKKACLGASSGYDTIHSKNLKDKSRGIVTTGTFGIKF